MMVCTTQEHIAGHGSAASTGSAIAHRVQPSWKHRRNEAVLTKERAKERARQTRCEGVAMFRLRTALRSVAVITLTVVAGCLSGCAPFHYSKTWIRLRYHPK